jgi:predicted metal-dependent hydrolase
MIDYDVVYSNRRTIGITVERDRRVVVRVPRQASEQAIDDAVKSRSLWIRQKVRDPHKYTCPRPRKEFVSGETFLFLGQQYDLELLRQPTGTVKLLDRRFVMACTDRYLGEQLVRSWYLSQARHKLPTRIADYAATMGVSYKRIWVRELKHRWASYTSKGTLTFNWKIIQAPPIVIDYLIVHELAHSLEPNHSNEFWNIVAVHVPNWAKARSWLKQNGSSLDW